MTDATGPSTRKKRFSMLREFAAADWLTLANGFCGAGSILAVMQYTAERDRSYLWTAMALLPMALFFDFADGRIARWRRRSSMLGADLDSLADVISFGMAPAAMAFAVGMRASLDVVVLLCFVACGISRLARFNATSELLADDSGKVAYFEGTPIPTSVLLIVVLAVLTYQDRIGEHLLFGLWRFGPVSLHPLALMYFASGSAMISTIRVPKI